MYSGHFTVRWEPSFLAPSFNTHWLSLSGTSVRLTVTGENAGYSRLYLYNEATGQWQYLNSYADSVVTTDTAGRYLLTNDTLTFVHMNMYALAAAGVVLVAIVVVYIAVKKRYWFW